MAFEPPRRPEAARTADDLRRLATETIASAITRTRHALTAGTPYKYLLEGSRTLLFRAADMAATAKAKGVQAVVQGQSDPASQHTMLLRRDEPSARSRHRMHQRIRHRAIAGLGVVLSLAAFSSAVSTQAGRPQSPPSPSSRQEQQPRAEAPDPSCRPAPAGLAEDIRKIWAGFPGKTGIAVRQVGCDWVIGERLDTHFPQQSVSKLWVSIAVMDAVDRGAVRLDSRITLRPQDLTLFNEPMRWAILERGQVQLSVAQLIRNALQLSDNTANDRLLRLVGGPDRLRTMFRTKRLPGIRFGPGERLLQSGIAGLTWRPDFTLPGNFNAARSSLPAERRLAALDRYVADPVDGATPAGITLGLSRLARGSLLSDSSTAFLLDTLAHTRSGPRRLKGGLPPGWSIHHKTGTGQDLGRISTGYNDVGILVAPDGTRYAVAVMVGRTTKPIADRMAFMREVSAAVARRHGNSRCTGPRCSPTTSAR